MPTLNQIITEARLPKASIKAIRDSTDTILNRHILLAFHLASASLLRHQVTSVNRETFAIEYRNAWAETFYNIANYEKFPNDFKLPANNHLLICGWHFPEIFQYLNLVTEYNILFLVSQDADWFDVLKQSGHTLNFNMNRAVPKLSELMHNGRSMP